MKEYTCENRYQSMPLDKIQLGGKTKVLMDNFLYERVLSDRAKQVVYQEAEDAFKNQLDDETAVGLWQGEFWGKWMLSACGVYQYTQDAELKDFIVKGAYNLMKYQREDGYIGTYKNSLRMFLPTDEELLAQPEGASRQKWNWNIWCRKYTLWGLLACYEISKDEKILDAACSHATHLIKELAENNISLLDTGTFFGIPSCSILKPMLMLYRYTEKEEYFDFATKIIHLWEDMEGTMPNLIDNALTKKPFHLWKEDPFQWAKAYEMLSCFEGILEYWHLTGEEKYLQASECFYEIVKTYEQNLVGSVGFNDKFANAADQINAISEPCDAIHWMRFCYELFTLTGTAEYMDSFDYPFYNAFCASIFKDGKWGARGVRGAGRHFYVSGQTKLSHNHCCVDNMPRAFMTMAKAAVMQNESQVVINLYDVLSASREDMDISISEGYFAKGEVEIHISFAKETKEILLRVPEWSRQSVMTYHEKSISVEPGYAAVKPEEKEVHIQMKFDITPQIHEFEKPVPQHNEESPLRRRWLLNYPTSEAPVKEDLFLQEKRATITSGPIILCKSKLIGNTEEEIFPATQSVEKDMKATLTLSEHEQTRVCYILGLSDGKTTREIKVCDLASAGNFIAEDDRYFSIYF